MKNNRKLLVIIFIGLENKSEGVYELSLGLC